MFRSHHDYKEGKGLYSSQTYVSMSGLKVGAERAGAEQVRAQWVGCRICAHTERKQSGQQRENGLGSSRT